jgi:uncharacterized membrane protein required for colicin V production
MHLNIIDMAAWAIILVSVAAGFYQGFLATAANTVAFFLSSVSAWLFYGGAAAKVKAAGKLIPALIYYSEAADMLGSVDTYRTAVAGITPEALGNLLKGVTLPHPIDQWLTHNVLNAVYAGEGISNLGDYLSRTVAEAAVSIACFLAILLGVYIGFTLLINLTHYVARLPALRAFDGVLGGVIGLGRGVLLIYVLFLILPVVLSMLPVHQISDVVASSKMAAYFYQRDFLFGMIRSFIG